jgi:hypothetical protein
MLKKYHCGDVNKNTFGQTYLLYEENCPAARARTAPLFA